MGGRKRAAWVGAVALVSLTGACGDDLVDFDEFTAADAAADAGTDAPSPIDAAPSPDVREAAAVDAPPPPPRDAQPEADAADACPTSTADDAKGIFVIAGGDLSGACGTRALPCGSVQLGVDRAHQVAGKSIVYVARGTYVEAIALHAGERVEGGWDVLGVGPGATWVKACAGVAAAVVLRAPADTTTTLRAEAIGGEVVVSDLTVASKAQADVLPGESIVGVLARGADTKVTLEDVSVDVVGGGDGAAGASGDAGAPGVMCADAGDGAPGSPPGAQGLGADAGAFDDAGWIAPHGGDGTLGENGQNGTMGGKGQCVTCGSCTGLCQFQPANVLCAPDGLSGCGGGAGGAGSGGAGGGSSVAVLAWDARVDVIGGALAAGDGGLGGSGGAGGPGGDGGTAAQGPIGPSCVVGCALFGGNLCTPQMGAPIPGSPGGPGGAGSSGGAGGGGAGGSSFAIFEGGSAVVNVTGTTLAHGAAGAGGGPDAGAGSAGAAGDRGR